MRPRAAILAGALAVAMAVTAGAPGEAGAAARAHRRCADGGARVRIANEQVQVVERRGRTWACWSATGARHLIAAAGSADGPSTLIARRLRLSGHLLAFNQEYERDEVEQSVVLLDVRTGKAIGGADATAGVVAPRAGAADAVTSLALADDGAVAWIAKDDDLQPARYEVFRLDGDHGVLLAAGPDVDPASLALAPPAIYWTQAGAPQRAAFP